MLLISLLACGSSTPEPAPAPAPAEAPAKTAEPEEAEPAEAAPAASERLNLNTATEDALKAIPGITPKMVHEFEEYRPYKSIRQFRKEIGKYVSQDKVAGWEPYVYVPVHYDDCDAATLAQLPGVDEAMAETLIQGRPYGSKESFEKALVAKVGEEQAKAGAALLE